jgi:hypothetical protein
MKIKEYKTVVTQITDISKYPIRKDGRHIDIIVLATPAGRFSNYESFWNKCRIDVEKMSPEDVFQITYTEHVAKNGVVFKNFITVVRI